MLQIYVCRIISNDFALNLLSPLKLFLIVKLNTTFKSGKWPPVEHVLYNWRMLKVFSLLWKNMPIGNISTGLAFFKITFLNALSKLNNRNGYGNLKNVEYKAQLFLLLALELKFMIYCLSTRLMFF